MEFLTKLKSVAERIDKKILIASFLLTVLWYVWENFVIGVPHLSWVQYTFERYNLKYFIFLLGVYFLLFLSSVFYFYVTAKASNPVKILSFTFFALALIGEYGYWYALHRFMNPMDLEIALVATDIAIKRDAILSYLSWKSLFPVIAFALFVFYFKGDKRFRIHHYLLIVVIFFGTIFGTSFLLEKPKLFINDVPQLNGFYSFMQVLIKAPNYFYQSSSLKREDLPKINEGQTRPQKNIIFVVDESIRANNLSLYGYQRDTTPYLNELHQGGKLKKFNSCVSGATCSVSSGNLMFSGLTIDELPDTDFNVLSRPTLEQFAKSAGYQTYFFDGQMTTYWRGSSDDRKNTDHWKSLMEFSTEVKNEYEVDAEIARQVVKIINSSGGNFVWIWKRGVHAPYFDDFPKSETTWQPVSESVRLNTITREELVNTYDNGIKYNLDGFFKILVPEVLKNPNNIIVYTSDHGQNLQESGLYVSHCSNSKNEANVPLFLISAVGIKINSDYKATHANIFPTLLDLLEIPSANRKYKYADSLLDVNAQSPAERFYWGMDITSGTKIKFD